MNLNAKIDELWTKTKTGELRNRQARFAAIERLTDDYISATGKRPEPAQLDRLTTLCLYEEVTDHHPDKMARDDIPIMSHRQYGRRRKDELFVEEMHVGPAHITGGKTTVYVDSDDTTQSGKTKYYVR